MKRFSFLLLLSVAGFFAAGTAGGEFWRESEGRILVIRHGQRAVIAAPDYDPPLTAEGRMQAELAGKYLKKLNFSGVIYSSPYRRTLETASIIAAVLERPVYVLPELQEFTRNPDALKIRARSIAELRREFPRIAPDATLVFPWTVRTPETLDSVRDRTERALNALLKRHPGGELLLVTHGALLKGCHMLMTGRPGSGAWVKMNWNCALSEYRLRSGMPPETIRWFDVSFLPDALVTSNQRRYLPDRDAPMR